MSQNVPVILARDVANLGRVGELVNVRPGYARNYLVPNGLALPASPKRVAFFEHQKKLVEHKRRTLKADSEKRASSMRDVQVTISMKVGDQGKLFGSVTTKDIAKAMQAIGHNIHHKDVKLAEPLKAVGVFPVDIRLEADVTTQVKVIVAAEIVAEPVAAPEEPAEPAAQKADAAPSA